MKKKVFTIFLSILSFGISAQTLNFSGSLLDVETPIPFETINFLLPVEPGEEAELVFSVVTDSLGQYSTSVEVGEFFDLELYNVETSFCDEVSAEWSAEFDENDMFESITIDVFCNLPTANEIVPIAYPISDDMFTWNFSASITGNSVDVFWEINNEVLQGEEVNYTFTESEILVVLVTAEFENGEVLTSGIDLGVGDENAFNCNASFFPVLDSAGMSENVLYLENYSYGFELDFFWDFGDGGTSTEPLPTYTFEDGIFGTEICLTVSNESGCEDTYCAIFTEEIINEINGLGLMGDEVVSETSSYGFDTAKSGDAFEVIVLLPQFEILNTFENEHENRISLYPNPIDSDIIIEFSGSQKVSLEILDEMGRNLDNIEGFKSGNKLDFTKYTPGLYMIRIDGAEVRRVIKR